MPSLRPARRLFIPPRVLGAHGLAVEALLKVYRIVVIAQLHYAASACWGFTAADDKQPSLDAAYEKAYVLQTLLIFPI